ncbi:MAG: polyhydroxyalkanoate depolymerase, partial [Burkholderiaceae bacterium]
DIKTTALLTIEGELDDISGTGQTRAAHGLCTGVPESRRFHYDAMGAGHYGIFSGRRWREHVHPTVSAFIQRYGSNDAAVMKPALKQRAAPRKAASPKTARRAK